MPLFGRRGRRAATPQAQTRPKPYQPPSLRMPSVGPATVNETHILGLPAWHAAIRTLGNIVAGLPVLDMNGERIDITRKSTNRMHDTLLVRPQTSHYWRATTAQIVANMAIYGNAFAIPTEINEMGEVRRVQVVHPNNVTSLQGDHEWDLLYQIGSETYTTSEIAHWRGPLQVGGYGWGISPLRVAAALMSVHASELEVVRTSYEAAARVHGYLSSPGNVTEDRMAEMVQEFASIHAGRGAGIVGLTNGTQWHTASVNHAEMELLEARQWSTTEAAMMLGIPPHLIGAASFDSQTYSTVAADMRALMGLTLDAWRECVSAGWADLGVLIQLGESDLTMPSMQERTATTISMLDAGLISREQAAERLGLPAPPTLTEPPTDTDSLTETDDHKEPGDGLAKDLRGMTV